MAKTKKEIEEYVKSKKGSFISLFKRNNKDYISFRDALGHFTGWISKSKEVIKNVKKYHGIKVRIKFKQIGKRKRERVIITVYNKKQQKEILFRMNKKLRDKSPYKRGQRERGLDDTSFRNDAIPYSGKKKVDMLFDEIEWKPVEIVDYIGESP